MADEQEVNTSPELEKEARELGWVPEAEFRGDPARWVSAETFVERGHTVMPILKKTNQRLDAMVRQQADEIKSLKGMVTASQESITELMTVHADATAKAVKDAKAAVRAELKLAKENGDVDREIQLTEELQELNQPPVVPTAKPAASAKPTEPPVDPDLAAWQAENKWYGTDERKTIRAMGVAQILRSDPSNDNLQGRAFYDRVVELMEEQTRPGTSKVAEARGSGGGAGSGAKGFADLPADAKEACDRQGKKLVGPGRAFKTAADWQKYYTKLYFEGA